MLDNFGATGGGGAPPSMDLTYENDAKPVHCGKVWLLRHDGTSIRLNLPRRGRTCVTCSLYRHGTPGHGYLIVSVDKVMLKDCGYISLRDIRVSLQKRSHPETMTPHRYNEATAAGIIELYTARNDRPEPVMAFTCTQPQDVITWFDVLRNVCIQQQTEAIPIRGGRPSEFLPIYGHDTHDGSPSSLGVGLAGGSSPGTGGGGGVTGWGRLGVIQQDERNNNNNFQCLRMSPPHRPASLAAHRASPLPALQEDIGCE